MRYRSDLIRHLLSVLVLGTMLLLALGTSIMRRFDTEIRTTGTGLLVRYEGDGECQDGQVIIESELADESSVWYLHDVGNIASGDSVEAEFVAFKSHDGLSFVQSEHANARARLACGPPLGDIKKNVPLGEMDVVGR